MNYRLGLAQDCYAVREAPPTFASEAALSGWWTERSPRERFRSVDGRDIVLVEQGRPNRHDGPDFENALLVVDGEWVRGDVECHTTSSNWRRHGHDRDYRYCDVVLHLVYSDDGSVVRTALGTAPLTVVAPSGTEAPGFRSGLELLSEREVMERLSPFIHRRWLSKVGGFERSLAGGESRRDIFLIATFRALGIPGNETPFEALAGVVSLTGKKCSPAEWTERLTRLAGLREGGGGSGLAWRRGGIRPAGRPERRLIFAGVVAAELSQGWKPWKTEDLLSGGGLNRRFGSQLPGTGWVTEWLGNVLVPLRGVENTRGLERWYSLKLPSPYGRQKRHFEGRIPSHVLRSFAVAQGLLQLELETPTCTSALPCPLCRQDAPC